MSSVPASWAFFNDYKGRERASLTTSEGRSRSSLGTTGGTDSVTLAKPSVRFRFTYQDVRQSTVRQPGKVQEREHLSGWLDDDPLTIAQFSGTPAPGSGLGAPRSP